MNASIAPQGATGAVNGQRLVFFGNGAASNTFTSSDITNILNTATTDLSTQMNNASTRVQNWSSGGG